MLFNTKGRNLGEGRWLNPADPPGKFSLPAPMLDHHLCAGTNLDSIRAQHVDHDFEITRVSDLQQWRARLHDGFAFLRDFQYHAGNRGSHAPAFGRRIGAIAIPGQHALASG